MNMKCIILVAGRNTRLDTGKPKSLIELNGVSLLERHIKQFKNVGCDHFCFVTGHNPQPIRDIVGEVSKKYEVQIDLVHNDQYDLENGYSVSVTEDWVKLYAPDGFFLTMGDHVFEQSFLFDFKKSIEKINQWKALYLAVDIPSELNRHVDIEDVTRVLVDDLGQILNIGKMINDYNRYDTGLFYMKSGVFSALNKCFAKGEYSISNMVNSLVENHDAQTKDVVGYLWNDVDNLSDLNITANLNF